MRACQPKDAIRREWRSVPACRGGRGRSERDKELTLVGCGRERERAQARGGRGETEREKEPTHVACRGERERKRFGSSSPGPALCKLGLARSAVHST